MDDVDTSMLPESGPVILHIDLDVIDAAEFPGLRIPAENGPALDAVLGALSRLLDSGRVTVLDIVWPWLDPRNDQEQGVRAALLVRVLDLRPDL